MTYRERGVKMLKVMGQDIIDRAEELIPEAQGIKSVNVWLRIPTLSDDLDNVPEIEVCVDLYPDRKKYSLFEKSLYRSNRKQMIKKGVILALLITPF